MGEIQHRGTTAEGVVDAQPFARPSRRSMLKGSALALAGAIGWGAGAAVKSGGAASATAAGTLTLDGVNWRSAKGGAVSHGELTGARGAGSGSFNAAQLAGSGAELQTFNLAGGSIFGMGTPPARGEGVATFAILGGTGSFAGATGTYTQEQRPTDRGGDGTARFQFTFANQPKN